MAEAVAKKPKSSGRPKPEQQGGARQGQDVRDVSPVAHTIIVIAVAIFQAAALIATIEAAFPDRLVGWLIVLILVLLVLVALLFFTPAGEKLRRRFRPQRRAVKPAAREASAATEKVTVDRPLAKRFRGGAAVLLALLVLLILGAASLTLLWKYEPLLSAVCSFAPVPSQCVADATREPSVVERLKALQAPASSINRSEFTISVRFAGGGLLRENIVAQAEAFERFGWLLDDVAGRNGGTRTGDASGVNEVRYAPGDELAARQLATDAQLANLNNGATVGITEDRRFTKGKLQLWISR